MGKNLDQLSRHMLRCESAEETRKKAGVWSLDRWACNVHCKRAASSFLFAVRRVGRPLLCLDKLQ